MHWRVFISIQRVYVASEPHEPKCSPLSSILARASIVKWSIPFNVSIMNRHICFISQVRYQICVVVMCSLMHYRNAFFIPNIDICSQRYQIFKNFPLSLQTCQMQCTPPIIRHGGLIYPLVYNLLHLLVNLVY